MPSASIRSLVNSLSPISGASRDDLKAGDVVTLQSVNVHTTYAWTIAFKPVGSIAVFSGSPVAATPGNFTVDKEGPYLVRLTADLGTSTESTQYVRLRYLTVFGELRLVAAGEGYGLVGFASATITVSGAAGALSAGDTVTVGGLVLTGVAGVRASGANNFNTTLVSAAARAAEIASALNDPLNNFASTVFALPAGAVVNLQAVVAGAPGNLITLTVSTAVAGALTASAAALVGGYSIPVPVDIGSTGWSDQQNYNHQMVLGLLARLSTSGRVLYVDSNVGTHMTSGRIVVLNPLIAGDTVVISGVSLTGVAGPRTAGANDFNATLTTTTALAAEIAAALNDPLNGFATSVTASVSLNSVLLTPASGLIVTLSTSTTPAGGITVGQGYADFTSVQDAIDAASAAGAGINNPYSVMVRPGLYTEDLDFKPFVHVFGAEGNPSGAANQRAVVLRGSHTITTSVNSDLVVLGRLTLENITSGTASTLVKNGLGSVNLYRCDVEQQGLGATQGPAFRLNRGVAFLDYCTVAAHPSLADDRSAITQPGGNASTLYVRGCIVRGPTGLTLNSSLGSSVIAEVYDSRIVASGAAGVGVISDAESLLLEYTNINTVSGIPLQVHPGAAVTVNPIGITIRWCFLDGPIYFDTTNIGGATTLQVGSSEYAGFTLPGGTPSVMAATTKATSLFYDNTVSGMAAENVQDAIDEAYAAAILVRTLDDAYDGGVPNSGSGRTIVADQGSVQIVDAPVTSDPPPVDNANGRLEVVAAVKVGALGFPEIDIDPNPYGFGPTVVMGNRVIPPNIPFGAGTAMVMGRSTGTPLFRNYNLRIQTQSSDGGGEIGRLILQGGDGLDNGASTPDASSVFIQAGTSFDPTAAPGSLYLAPGRRQGGNPGSIVFVRPAGNTAATLTAAGVCSSPLGVTGNVTFATNMGAVTASLLSTDTLAQVVTKLDALEGISANQSLGVITLTTEHEGPNAEIYFLSADAGVDTALGVFNGQNQVDGTYGSFIAARVTADHELTLGVGGAVGPLIYNADTGKLTVPGLIDPTGIIFEEAGPPGTGATEGAVFVSDGTSGLTLGDLYYRGPSNAVPVSVGGGGGGESLAATLVIGNSTGGTNIVLTAGDILQAGSSPAAALSAAGTGRLRYNNGTTQFEGSVNGGAWAALGKENLAATLGFGNTTGGTNLILTSGDDIRGESSAGVAGTVTLRGGTDSGAGPTAGGSINLRPGTGVGGGTDGLILMRNAAATNVVQFTVTAAEEITIGATLPMIYNATTGKLTVPGVIDPTGLVFEEFATPPVTAANEGGLFVGNGTAPYADNVLYFVPASAGAPIPLSTTSGSGGTLLHRLQVEASANANVQAATAFGFDVAALATNPSDGDTLVINDSFNPVETYTFRTVPTLAFEVLINAVDVRITLTNLVEAINRDSTQNVAVKVTDLTRLQTNAAVRGHAAVIVTLTSSAGNPRIYGSFTVGANPRARNFALNQARYDTDSGWSTLDSVDPGVKKFFGYASDGFTRYPTGATLSTASSPTLLARQVNTPTTTVLWLSPTDRLAWKNACRVATTVNIASVTAAAPDVVDAVTLTPGDRVMVWQQTTAAQNGIYEVRAAGSGANGKWVRASDFKTYGVATGTRTFIQEGSSNGQTYLTVMTPGAIIVGGTAITFIQEAPLVRTDAASTEIIAATAFTSGTIIWSTALDMRDFSEVSVWFNPTVLGANTQVILGVQWSDDGATIPFDDDNGLQQTDFLLNTGTDGSFKPKNYSAKFTTATGELVAGSIKMLSFPKKGGSFRVGIVGDNASGSFTVRAQRLA